MPSTSLAADSFAIARADLTTMSLADTATAAGAAPCPPPPPADTDAEDTRAPSSPKPLAALRVPLLSPTAREEESSVGELDAEVLSPPKAPPAAEEKVEATAPASRPGASRAGPTAVVLPSLAAGAAAAAAAVVSAAGAEPLSSVLHRSALLSTVENWPVSHRSSEDPHAATCASDDKDADEDDEDDAVPSAVAAAAAAGGPEEGPRGDGQPSRREGSRAQKEGGFASYKSRFMRGLRQVPYCMAVGSLVLFLVGKGKYSPPTNNHCSGTRKSNKSHGFMSLPSATMTNTDTGKRGRPGRPKLATNARRRQKRRQW